VWKAFNRLSTTRPRGFSAGPISYREVMTYADDYEMGPNRREFLWDVIEKVDRSFLNLLAEKTKQESKKPR
jgi:hypothetical protein